MGRDRNYEEKYCDEKASTIPCPKCHNAGMAIVKKERRDIRGHVGFQYLLHCIICNIRGPAYVYEPVAGNLLQRKLKESRRTN